MSLHFDFSNFYALLRMTTGLDDFSAEDLLRGTSVNSAADANGQPRSGARGLEPRQNFG